MGGYVWIRGYLRILCVRISSAVFDGSTAGRSAGDWRGDFGIGDGHRSKK